MPLGTSLPLLAIGGLVPGLARAVGGRVAGAAATAAVQFVVARLCDPSLRVRDALDRATGRAWDTLALALDPAGDSFLDRAEDAALARQVRAVAVRHARAHGWADPAAFLTRCRDELRAARPADGWAPLTPDPAELTARLGDWLRFADPTQLAALHTDLTGRVADDLRAAGFAHLAGVVALPHPGDAAGTPVLAAAVHYYLRREVEDDPRLFQGLAFAHLERQSDDLGRLLDAAAETRSGLLDLKRDLERLGRTGGEPAEVVPLVLAAAADPALDALFGGHSGAVTAVAAGPGRVLSGGADGTVRAWDPVGRRAGRVFDGAGSPVVAVGATADGGRVWAATADHRLVAWDAATGRPGPTLPQAYRGAVAFAADGTIAVCGAPFDGKLRCLDLLTGKETRRLPGHADRVVAAAVSRDGRRAVSVGRDGAVKLWDLLTGRLVREARLAGPVPESVGLLADGRVILAGPAGVTVVRLGAPPERVAGDLPAVSAVAVPPAGRAFAVASGSAVVLVHGRRLTRLGRVDAGSAVTALAFDPGGGRLVAGGADGAVRVFTVPVG